jgi:hypothetical protein
MYFPERLRTSPAAAGLPEAHEISLATRDRETVIIWHVPPRGEKPVVLYFHGNGGALRCLGQSGNLLTPNDSSPQGLRSLIGGAESAIIPRVTTRSMI